MSIKNDKYWTQTADYVRKHCGNLQAVVAPAEFREVLNTGLRYDDANSSDLSAISTVVVHKGQLEKIDRTLLTQVATGWPAVFANEVFVVFNRNGRPLESDKHMQSFLEKFKQLAQSAGAAPASLKQLARSAVGTAPADSWNGTLFNTIALREEARRHFNQDQIRLRCRSTYVGNRTAVSRVLGKYKMFVDTADIGLSTHLLTDGFWEMWVTEYTVQTVRPGMVVVDVGANLGYYSLLLADLSGSDGRLIAVEPNRQIARLLKWSLAVNGFEHRARVHECALSDRDDGSTALVIPVSEPKNAWIVDDAGPFIGNPDYRIETIDVRSLDQLLHSEDKVDFIKIDAEGAEWKIWKGAQRTLQKNKNIIVALEFNVQRYGSPGDFIDEICSLGFPLRHIDFNGGVKPVSKQTILSERINEDWMLVLDRRA